MNKKRLLVYFDDQRKTRATTGQLEDAFKHVANLAGLAIQEVEDFSLVQGEPCLFVQISGLGESMSPIEETCRAQGLRICDADQDIHELGETHLRDEDDK